jgi:type II secretory pathway pseudopilin PulG
MTLIECLLSLAFLSFLLAAGMGSFALAGRMFARIREAQEERQAVMAALDKVKYDARRAGEGLAELNAAAAGLQSIRISATGLEIVFAEQAFTLEEEVPAGAWSIRISAASYIGFSAGREMIVGDPAAAETFTISSVSGHELNLDHAAQVPHPAGGTSGALLERVLYSLDGPKGTLRRRVNGSTAQPVMEGVKEAVFEYDAASNIFMTRLVSSSKGELTDGFSLFIKNAGLPSLRH